MGALNSGPPGPDLSAIPARSSRPVFVAAFRSRDQDETRAYISPKYGEHTRVIHGDGSFLYDEQVLATERVIAGRAIRQFRQTLRAAVNQPTLFRCALPGESIQFGRRVHALEESLAVLCAPEQEYTLRGPAAAFLALRVDRDLLEREIDARVRRRAQRWVLGSVPVPMLQPRRAELDAFFAQLRAVASPDGGWGHYGDAETFDRAVSGWMAELLLQSTGVVPVGDLTLDRLVRLERWIDQHLGEDLPLERLCGVAGVSSRPLQKTFLSVRGQSPLEYVHSRRLAAVRRRLEQAPIHASVSTIALDCGFRHLGRFAATYRAAYGESPSDTLKSGQRRPTQSG